MVPILEELKTLPSRGAMRLALGRYLGLPGPVKPAVLRRAEVESRFALHLVMSRASPDSLELHLSDDANRAYESSSDASDEVEPAERTNAELVGAVGGALLRWGQSGFQRLDEATIASRLEQCTSCPHLVAAPDRLLYKVRLVGRSDPRICDQCGCTASAKVKLATERCPIGRWERAT